MHTKTMEGLIGARANMDMANVPMKVYKEARRRGDTAAMKRAMGYVNEFEYKAEEYKKKAGEGMKKDAQEAAEKEKAQQEDMIEKRREERRLMEEKLAADRDGNAVQCADAKIPDTLNTGVQSEGATSAMTDADTVQLSRQGKDLSEKQVKEAQRQYISSCPVTGQGGAAPADRKPVVYRKTGEAVSQSKTGSISVLI